MSSTVRQILSRKSGIFAVEPDATVYDALRLMAQKNIGAVLVVQGGQLTGIFSERDYARKVVLLGKASRGTPVSEIMTSPVFCVSPNHTAEQCMAVMTDRRIRHLPVIEDGVLVGVVSIGDVVGAVLSEQQRTISDLVGYIVGGS